MRRYLKDRPEEIIVISIFAFALGGLLAIGNMKGNKRVNDKKDEDKSKDKDKKFVLTKDNSPEELHLTFEEFNHVFDFDSKNGELKYWDALSILIAVKMDWTRYEFIPEKFKTKTLNGLLIRLDQKAINYIAPKTKMEFLEYWSIYDSQYNSEKWESLQVADVFLIKYKNKDWWKVDNKEN